MNENTTRETTRCAWSIQASDFSQSLDDTDRHTWTAGKMIHLVQALGEQPVTIVLDKGTGHTLANVHLMSVRANPFGGGHQVLVQTANTNGVTEAWYHLQDVGTIIGTGDSQTRWRAIRSYANEVTVAIVEAGRRVKALYPHLDRVLWGSSWNVSRFPGEIQVSFTPDRDAFPHSSGVEFHYWSLPVGK